MVRLVCEHSHHLLFYTVFHCIMYSMCIFNFAVTCISKSGIQPMLFVTYCDIWTNQSLTPIHYDVIIINALPDDDKMSI